MIEREKTIIGITTRKGREMKVRDVIKALKQYEPDDHIVLAWFDLEYASNTIESLPNPIQLEQAWREIIEECQDTMNSHLDFTNTGAEISDLLKEKLEGEN